MDRLKGALDVNFNDNLIREVRRNPMVYDPTHPYYGNALKKHETWNEIAGMLGERVEAVKTRWRTLRDRYTKERRRVTTLGGVSTFSYYSDLTFLDSFAGENRKSYGNLNGSVGRPEHSEQTSDGCDDADSHPEDAVKFRIDNQRMMSNSEENDESCSSGDVPRVTVQSSALLNDPVEFIPKKRAKYEINSPLIRSDNKSLMNAVVESLVQNVETLQKIVDRRPPSIQRSSLSTSRDVDESFANYIYSALKAIDHDSRVHARIAIVHALSQYQA